MKSRTPKPLHRIAGREMLSWVRQAVSETSVGLTVTVVGPEFPANCGESANGARQIVQRERLGTGHALLQTEALLAGRADHVLVLNGDMPLISSDTLNLMMDRHLGTEAALTLLTCEVEDPGQMGRVVRGVHGENKGSGRVAGCGPRNLNLERGLLWGLLLPHRLALARAPGPPACT